MERNLLQASGFIIILLGVTMMVLGFYSAPKILYPPIITGIGFIVIGWVFFMLKKK